MNDSTGPHLVPVPDAPDRIPPPPRRRTRVKKLRLLALLIPLVGLALVSTVFGMMMAVASDLPSLEALPQVAKRKNSILYDVRGTRLTTLTSNQGRIIVSKDEISNNVKNAVISIEDRRFYSNSGVDLKAIGRAFAQDLLKGRQAQGGSTIAQQFIKNALQAQNRRTVFEKLREAALAYHLTRKWSKDRILTEYLNSVYFGNGAYGVEAAARTYFGSDPNHAQCGTPNHRMCASELTPSEGAMLAAIIASPSRFDPVAHPVAARGRRNLVLTNMLEQGHIREPDYQAAVREQLISKPEPARIEARPGSEYFVSWVRQSLVDQVGPQQAFEGDLRVRTTLDLGLQADAQAAVTKYLSFSGGPTASVVVIDNDSGEVRAMVGGRDYKTAPFNLATQGQRQPGSAFKPFILAEALRQGISPATMFPSRKRVFNVKHSSEKFVVNNFEDEYFGESTIANALTHSDNSVFAALGIRIGTHKVARLATRLGVRTPVSANDAMTLGGLQQGVTPLDMAHAYETFAEDGRRISGTLGTSEKGPVGIVKITRGDGDHAKVVKTNRTIRTPVLQRKLAQQETELLTGPVRFGTATRAQYGGFAAGKTGTTENNGDAWFVGFTRRWTVAVWVGYPDTLKPMLTDFAGSPVTGGTVPALIWREFIIAANRTVDDRINLEREAKGLPPLTTTTTTVTPSTPTTATGSTDTTPTTDNATTGGASGTGAAPTATTPPATDGPTAPDDPSAGAGTPHTGGAGATGGATPPSG
jgi:penicillin-binding protein 1A